jgi:Beta-lactamase enzyme family
MTERHGYVATTSDLLPVAEAIAREWERVGVAGHLLARNIDTGEELGFDIDRLVPLASVVKVPIGLTVLHLIARGDLDAARQITVDPDTSSLGPTGVAAFRYPATVAVGDLVLQMLTVSDNAAADALLDCVGIDQVTDSLREWECPDIRVRHRLHRMYECAAGAAGGDFALAVDLAIQSDETGRPAIETLDPAYANVGSAGPGRPSREGVARPDRRALRDRGASPSHVDAGLHSPAVERAAYGPGAVEREDRDLPAPAPRDRRHRVDLARGPGGACRAHEILAPSDDRA